MRFDNYVESKTYGFFDWLYRLVIINLITILLCLPVITLLPALVAAYATVSDHLSGNGQSTIRLYFRNFVNHLEKGFIIGLVILVTLGICTFSIMFYSNLNQGNLLSQAGFYVMIFFGLLIAFMAVHIPILMVNFPDLDVPGIFRATLYVTFKYIMTTFLLLGILILTLAELWLLPISLVIGVSGPIFLAIKLTRPVYEYLKKIKLDEKLTTQEEDNED